MMMENTYASLEHYLHRYEARQTGAPLPPHEQMLARLFVPAMPASSAMR